MSKFNPWKTNDKLINLLSKARVDFGFGKKDIRNRLMTSIEEHQLSSAEKKVRELTHKSFLLRHRIGTSLSLFLLLVAASGAALAEAEISKPGDKLHTIDNLGERLLLKLPVSPAQKANLHANILDERDRELDYLLNTDSHDSVTEAVKESQMQLSNAVENVMSARENSIMRGQEKQAAKLDEVITRLQGIAERQEEKVMSLIEEEKDAEVKKELQMRMDEIKKAKQRAVGR